MKTFHGLTLAFIILIANACSSTSSTTRLGPLIGKTWELTSFSGQSPDLTKYPAGLPTINFLESDRLAGFAGCNNFSGEFALEGGSGAIKLDPGAVTRKACLGSGEEEFLEALEKVKNFKVEKEKLILMDGATELMSFTSSKD